MAKRIRNMFDYQRFSPNARLEAMIEETERRYVPLDDEDLLLVSAAGDSGYGENRQDTFEEIRKKIADKLISPNDCGGEGG